MRTWLLETEDIRLQMFSGDEPTLGLMGLELVSELGLGLGCWGVGGFGGEGE